MLWIFFLKLIVHTSPILGIILIALWRWFLFYVRAPSAATSLQRLDATRSSRRLAPVIARAASALSFIHWSLCVRKTDADMEKRHRANVLVTSCLKTPVDPHTKVPLALYERERALPCAAAAAGFTDNSDYEKEVQQSWLTLFVVDVYWLFVEFIEFDYLKMFTITLQKGQPCK